MTGPVGSPKKDPEFVKDVQLLVPFERRHNTPLRYAAQLAGRAVSDYIRFCVLTDMQRRGVLDETFAPIAQEEERTEIVS